MAYSIEYVYMDFLYDCYVLNKRLTEIDWLYHGRERHHIEIPSRDGGTLTPLNCQYLTTYQHWIAGVLQSEVLQKCCFAFVPRGVLPGNFEELRLKWNKQLGYDSTSGGVSCYSREWHQQEWVTEYKRRNGQRAVAEGMGIHNPGYKESAEFREILRKTALKNVELKKGIHGLTSEQKAKIVREAWGKLSTEERSERGRRAWVGKSNEERSKVARESAKTVKETYTQERMLERNRKIARARAPRPIILTTPEGLDIFYELMYDACLEYNLDSSRIGDICKGRRKSHKGFTAQYAD